jgi:hypothetical protein
MFIDGHLRSYFGSDRPPETVAKFVMRSKSCHDRGLCMFPCPHPNPLPEGEGQAQSGVTLPSPFGRGTEGEGIRATILVVPRILQQFLRAGRLCLALPGAP